MHRVDEGVYIFYLYTWNENKKNYVMFRERSREH